MIEEQLKSLGQVKVNKERKEEQWQQIESQISKKAPLHWQVPAVLIASITIFVMLLTIPLNLDVPSTSTTASEKPTSQIKTIYTSKYYDSKTKPISNFYPGILKLNDKEAISNVNTILTQSEWELFNQDATLDDYEYKLVYTDGLVKYFSYYYDSNAGVEYLIEQDSKYAYSYTYSYDGGEVYNLRYALRKNAYNLSWGGYLLFFGILIIRAWHDMSYKRKNKLDRLPKMHITHWQSIFTIITVATLLSTTVFVGKVHFAWWIVGVVLNLFICLKLNKVEAHHAWRIRTIIINNVMFIIYAMTFLYPLI